MAGVQGSGGYHGPDASDEGVQRDLLPLLEGSTVTTRYGDIRTDYILFIASGELADSKQGESFWSPTRSS